MCLSDWSPESGENATDRQSMEKAEDGCGSSLEETDADLGKVGAAKHAELGKLPIPVPDMCLSDWSPESGENGTDRQCMEKA